jgi:hypothetical protein
MKIGILTHYFKSQNYGGNLQAFALVYFLSVEGFDAEQICYDVFFKRKNNASYLKHFLLKICFVPKFFLNLLIKKIMMRKRFVQISKNIKKRCLCIQKFNSEVVKHSFESYGFDDICKANEKYDAFITGSDQVWHPNNFCPAYLLSFVNMGKKKISYAASIAKNYLTKKEVDCLVKSISNYTAVSVREEDSAAMLRRYCAQNISCVVDPVFLLSSQQWNSIAAPYTIDRPYVLTYFLGANTKSRILAKQFAESNGLKLVSIPYLNGSYRKCDWNFGDEQLFDVGPDHFLSLVRNAAYVFTDSFHATAFAILFDTKFFVFPRNCKTNKDMSNRIISILNLCRCRDFFCDTVDKANIDYLESRKKSYIIDKDQLADRVLFSKRFLLDALNE